MIITMRGSNDLIAKIDSLSSQISALQMRQIYMEQQMSDKQPKHKKLPKQNKDNWITREEPIGTATLCLLIRLKQELGSEVELMLPSLKEINHHLYLSEIDRERAVRMYCEHMGLISNNSVYLDEFLYNLVSSDNLLASELSGVNKTILICKKGSGYRMKISTALRRLDMNELGTTN